MTAHTPGPYTARPPVALALGGLGDAGRSLHSVRVPGTVTRLNRGRWYSESEPAWIADDPQAATSLDCSTHDTTTAPITNKSATTGIAGDAP